MMDAVPPRKRIKLGFSDMFEVLVGEGAEQQKFTFHHDLFTKRSGFFRAARQQRWTAQGKPTELFHHGPEVFELYVSCVYSNAVVDLAEFFKDGETIDLDTAFVLLVKLYALADELQDLRTANLTMDELIRFSESYDRSPVPDSMTLAYERTPERSPLRLFMRDMVLHFESTDSLPDCVKLLPQELLADVVLEFARIQGENEYLTMYQAFRQYPNTRPMCHYHQHDDDTPTCE